MRRRSWTSGRPTSNASLQALEIPGAPLVRSERLSAVGEMASVIGHELRNPLAAVTNSLFIVRNDLGEDVSARTEKYLSMAERETRRRPRWRTT